MITNKSTYIEQNKHSYVTKIPAEVIDDHSVCGPVPPTHGVAPVAEMVPFVREPADESLSWVVAAPEQHDQPAREYPIRGVNRLRGVDDATACVVKPVHDSAHDLHDGVQGFGSSHDLLHHVGLLVQRNELAALNAHDVAVSHQVSQCAREVAVSENNWPRSSNLVFKQWNAIGAPNNGLVSAFLVHDTIVEYLALVAPRIAGVAFGELTMIVVQKGDEIRLIEKALQVVLDREVVGNLQSYKSTYYCISRLIITYKSTYYCISRLIVAYKATYKYISRLLN